MELHYILHAVGTGNLEVHITIIAQLNLASVAATQETLQVIDFLVMSNKN